MSLLTPAEVADRLRFARADRVYEMINAGELLASNVGSGSRPRWRVSEVELERFLARREKPVRAKRKKSKDRSFDPVPSYV